MNNNNSNNMDWLGVASLGVDALGSVLGISSQNAALKKQFEYNKRLQELAQQYNTSERIASQQYNKEMLDYSNAYNSPLAQRQRLQDAGYNPYMSNVSSGTSANTSISPQSSTASNVGLSNIGSSVQSSFSNMANIIAQRQKVNSEANRNTSDSIRNLADAGLIGSNRKRIESLLPYEQMQITALVDNLRADQKYKQELEKLTISQNIGQKLGNEYQQIINKYADEGQQQQLVKLASDIALLCSQYDVNQAQRKELLSRAVKNYADANFANINTNIAQKDLKYITDTLDTSIAMTNMENALTTISMSNMFDAEKTFGKTIAWNQAQANMYQSQKLRHLSLGSRNFYKSMSPGYANAVEGTLNAASSGVSQLVPMLGMTILARRPKPVYQFF